MKCDNCGAILEEKDSFCFNCGNRVNGYDDEILIKEYVGSDYDKLKKNKFNFKAFFFPTYNLAYRKEFAYAICMFLIMCLFLRLSIAGVILVRTLNGMFFNKLYLKLARKRVKDILNQNKDLDNNRLLEEIKKQGGVSNNMVFYMVILVIVFFPIININGLRTVIYTFFDIINGSLKMSQALPQVISGLIKLAYYILQMIFE